MGGDESEPEDLQVVKSAFHLIPILPFIIVHTKIWLHFIVFVFLCFYCVFFLLPLAQ